MRSARLWMYTCLSSYLCCGLWPARNKGYPEYSFCHKFFLESWNEICGKKKTSPRLDTWYTNTTIYTVFHEQMVIERPQSNQAFIRALCHHAFFTMNLGKSAGDWNPNEAVVRWYVKIFLCARWWFYIFLMFILSWRDDPFWLICFKAIRIHVWYILPTWMVDFYGWLM